MFNLFEKLINPFTSELKNEKSRELSSYFRWQIGEVKNYLLLTALFSGLMSFSEVYLFNFLGGAVDVLSSAAAESKVSLWDEQKWLILKACIALFICLPIAFTFHALLLNQTLFGNIQVKIIAQINKHLLKQDLSFFMEKSTGKLAASILQLSGSTRFVLVKVVDLVVYLGVFILSASFIIVERSNWIVLLPVCVWIVAYIRSVIYFLPQVHHFGAIEAGKRADVSGKIVDVYSNILTVKLFSGCEKEVKHSFSYLSAYLKAIFLQMRVMSKISFATWTLNIFLIFSTGALCVYFWSISIISIGTVSAIIALILRLYTMSHWVIWEVAGLTGEIGVIKDGLSILDGTKIINRENEKKIFAEDSKLSISFADISFGFDAAKPIFNHFSLEIGNKEKVGLVGHSGSGKSTVIKLLLGFYHINSGKILVGGKDITEISPDELVSVVGVVSQDIELLNRSIFENIAYGNDNATYEQVVSAAKLACANEFIDSMIDEDGNRGYSCSVGERGAKLSGGQKQRIALARAILKNAPILILDEATSALDSITEREIINNLKDYLSDKTVIFIAHRMSTIRLMDRVVVMQDGAIIESGTHEELMALNGVYKSLWMSHSSHENTDILEPSLVRGQNKEQFGLEPA